MTNQALKCDMTNQAWVCDTTDSTTGSDNSEDGRSRATFKNKMQSQFHKISMCKFHLLTMCTKGDQCPYAHDESELRHRPDLTRTKLCEKFEATGKCASGNKCPYAHGGMELRTTALFHKTKACLFWPSGRCARGAKCRFAHGEVDAPASQHDNNQTFVQNHEPQEQHSQQKIQMNRQKIDQLSQNMWQQLSSPPGVTKEAKSNVQSPNKRNGKNRAHEFVSQPARVDAREVQPAPWMQPKMSPEMPPGLEYHGKVGTMQPQMSKQDELLPSYVYPWSLQNIGGAQDSGNSNPTVFQRCEQNNMDWGSLQYNGSAANKAQADGLRNLLVQFLDLNTQGA